MSSVATYIDELRTSLTSRHIAIDTIRDIVREVDSESSSYEEATSSFGTPGEYAKSFPEGKKPKGSAAFLAAAVILAVLWVLIQLITRDKNSEGLANFAMTWLPAWGLIALGITIDFSRFLARVRKSR
ncbi:hypothetical protein CIK76_00650 [Glutamicibacter sp. BW80]|uniref:hypothetical protein n=1 Tax=unclassified Glutamicibacter TaxID=2627139 RepID=UPI000BB9632C|nr:hypothetical protein [Glutamicibacter sp. BW80]PCC30540.1 hypothetical protein CIK76_00650 [Glutamicibacter sp. BW80]